MLSKGTLASPNLARARVLIAKVEFTSIELSGFVECYLLLISVSVLLALGFENEGYR